LRKKALLFIAMAIGAILLSLLLSTPVKAQDRDEGDPNAFQMPYPEYFIAGDCHSDGWGSWCALDPNSIPNGGPLFSPITAEVVAKGDNDGFTNTYICLQNSRWRVCMLHGIYNLVEVGDWVTIGQQLGTEASIGISTGAHTHLSVFDRNIGAWIDPRNALSGGSGYSAESTAANQSQDTSLNPQPGPVNWNIIGVEEPGKFVPKSTTATTQPATVVEYWEATYIQNDNPLRSYLAGINWIWFAALSLCLVFLTGSQGSRHWWPLWLVLITIVVISYGWSRTTTSTATNQGAVTEVSVFKSPPQPPEQELQLIFPDPPEAITETTPQPSGITAPTTVNIQYDPRVLKFDGRPQPLSGLDPGTQAWFEWLQAGNLQYETLWYWHNCKSVGIPDDQCSIKKYHTAAPPYEAVLAALTVHQLGGAPIWDNLTQKLQETGNGNGPFRTSSAAAMGPLQEKAWFFNTFSAFSGGNVQNYLDAMLAHSNWAITQGVLSHTTDQVAYAHRYAGAPCNPTNHEVCQYKGRYNNFMWNDYRGMGDSSYLLARALMESWISFQQTHDKEN
jgi:hypothetical protein